MTAMATGWSARFMSESPAALTGTDIKKDVKRPKVEERPQSSSTYILKDDSSAGTSSRTQENDIAIEREVRDLFDIARHTERHVGFEIGMDNPYRDYVHAFLQRYGESGVKEIGRLLPSQSRAVQAATIMYLGDADVPRPTGERLLLAFQCLESGYPEVRDAAGLALIDLDSITAVPVLAVAIEKEPLRSLKQNLEQARSYLKRPR